MYGIPKAVLAVMSPAVMVVTIGIGLQADNAATMRARHP